MHIPSLLLLSVICVIDECIPFPLQQIYVYIFPANESNLIKRGVREIYKVERERSERALYSRVREE